MSSSKDKIAIMRQIRKETAAFRSTRPDVLNDEQYEKLKEAFYKYAKELGWYKNILDAIKNNGKYIWDWQNDIIDDNLRSIFQKKGWTIGLSVKRQEGKTDIMALILIFAYENYFVTFGEPFAVGIVGPGQMTSSTVFGRLNNYLISQASTLAIDKSTHKVSLRGDSLTAFSISETGGTTIEGHTLNFILRDESHAGSDRRWRDEVLWTTAAKEGATIAMLGCAGYKKCDYMTLLEGGDTEDTRVHIVNYNRLRPYMRSLSEKGLKLAKGWEKRTEKLVRLNGGWNSPETRKNVFCEWQCHLGSYLSEDQIDACTKEMPRFDPDLGIVELVAFIDLGYSGDRSIATVMDMNGNILDWIMLKEANQTTALRDQLEKFFDVCDSRGYTAEFQAIGIDKTGLGIGAHEMLEEMSPCGTFPITFSHQKKFEMFTKLRNHVITEWEDDRIHFPEGHQYLDMVIEELTEIEQTPSEFGLLKFHAPENTGIKKFDDFCDSIAGCAHVLFNYKKQFKNVKSFRRREDRQRIFQKKLEKRRQKRKVIEAMKMPAHKRKKKRTLLSKTVGSW